MSFIDLTFFCDVIFTGWTGLEIVQKLLKNLLFPVLCVHKNDPMTVVFRYIVDSVNANMRVNLWLMCMFCSVVSE